MSKVPTERELLEQYNALILEAFEEPAAWCKQEEIHFAKLLRESQEAQWNITKQKSLDFAKEHFPGLTPLEIHKKMNECK